MKISIYSSGDIPPFWNIVFGHMTLKELEGVISFSSMMMNAAREAKLKIKDEDTNQLKIEFDPPKVIKVKNNTEEKAKRKKEEKDQRKRGNPYLGLGEKEKEMLAYLWEKCGTEEIFTTGNIYFDALYTFGITKPSFNQTLNDLEGYGHCTLNRRKRGRPILDSFKLHLNFKK